MAGVNRRDFLNTSSKSAFAAGVLFLSNAKSARTYAVNNQIVMGTVGLGGRGTTHAREFARRDDVQMAYICELDPERGRSMPDQIESIQGTRPKRVYDLREILDDKGVDAIVIATCDHWHGLATVWACQAGKDVYVEKPPSHNIWEGRKMVEAARKYDRIVQVGTQNRSAPYIFEALDYIKAGNLGDVRLVKVFNMKPGKEFHVPEDGPTPEGLNYDMYLGPAPSRPFNTGHFHGGWKKFWAYSGGDFADDGSHQIDIARMIINKEYPKRIQGTGGKFAFDDDREVPDTQVVTYEYDDVVMTFELTQWSAYMRKTSGEIRDSDLFPDWPLNATRIEVYGTKQIMYMGRHGGGWQAKDAAHEIVAQCYGRHPYPEHQQNFCDSVRSRKRPNADIEIGHRSACLIHMGNIACRVGNASLEFDAKTEQFTNNEAANDLLKRTYRPPYVVPETV